MFSYRLMVVGVLATGLVCPAQVAITEFPLPTSGSYPIGVTAGPDEYVVYRSEWVQSREYYADGHH
jgi:hypothetical protein